MAQAMQSSCQCGRTNALRHIQWWRGLKNRVAIFLIDRYTYYNMTTFEQITRPYAGDVPGCAIMIIRDDSPLLIKTQGCADIENIVPVTPDTNFRLASVSKHFTASAILALHKKGLLSLDANLGEFFPQCTENTKRVTIAQLLMHTSGLTDYEELLDKEYVGQIHDHEVVELLMQQDHGYFEPGCMFRYSNGGYCVLAIIIELVSGKSFAEFVRSELFAPLGMQNTFVNEEGVTAIPNRAYGYSRRGNAWLRTDQNATSATIGDGGVYSSLNDLALWSRALDTNSLFERRVLTNEQPSPSYYGFGLFEKEYGGTKVRYHAGGSIGFRIGFYTIPERKLTILFLSNRNEGNGVEMCEKILSTIASC